MVKIIDKQTGQQIGKNYTYKNRNRARARADKLDLEYGAYRYIVKIDYKQLKEILK